LALAHQGAGKIGLALEAVRKALVLEPGNGKYQQILEDLQQALAETEK
jgi:UDP-N-acetylglucosamine transferase subunit ALG13